MATLDPAMGGTPTPPAATPGKSDRKRVNPILAAFLPNQAISKHTLWVIIAIQVVMVISRWIASPFEVLPTPTEVLQGFVRLYKEQGLVNDLWISFKLILHALGLTILISLALSYLSVMPFFRPLAQAISK